MIGGLIRDSNSTTNSGFPFLVNLPYIGSLFGTKGSTKSASNLMIFITPTIVEDVLPRPTTVDGRRGRLVTDYERVPGEFDVNADMPEEGEAPVPEQEEAGMEAEDFEVPENLDDLLSGDTEEEQATLERLRELQRRRQEAYQQEEGEGNYVPSAGFGSATLNTGTAGQQAGQPQEPERPEPRFRRGQERDRPPRREPPREIERPSGNETNYR
jgi:hypothetical protein